MIKLVVPYYYPDVNAGGPAASVKGIVELLNSDKFQVITRAAGVAGDKFHPHELSPSTSRVVYTYGNLWVRLKYVFDDWSKDVVHINSMLDWSVVLPVLTVNLFVRSKRILLSPRGETLFIDKEVPRRKMSKMWYFRLLSSLQRDNVFILNTSEEEFASMDIIGFRNLLLSHNPISTKLNLSKRKEIKGSVRLVFVGRIVPHKRVKETIEILASNKEAVLSIIGPIENKHYWDECLNVIKKQKLYNRVRYLGGLSHEDVKKELPKHDILVLLSKSENFAHVIPEALTSGLRIIKSHGVPWLLSNLISLNWPFSDDEANKFITIEACRKHIPENCLVELKSIINLQNLKTIYKRAYGG